MQIFTFFCWLYLLKTLTNLARSGYENIDTFEDENGYEDIDTFGGENEYENIDTFEGDLYMKLQNAFFL